MSERLALYLDEDESPFVLYGLLKYRDFTLRQIGKLPSRRQEIGEKRFNELTDEWLGDLAAVRTLIDKTKYAIDAAFSPGELAQ